MPIEIIQHAGEIYPAFQASHNSARFILPFAQEICKGDGLDIGCGKREWAFPGAYCIDPALDEQAKAAAVDQKLRDVRQELKELYLNGYDARNLPEGKKWDFIFSSHCLEHLDRWVDVLDYWYENLKIGGVMFLYLPDYSQSYWRPWANRKHLHAFTPEVISDYMENKGFIKVMVSGVDLNNSFCAIGEK